MAIYYFMFEAEPRIDNPEKHACKGAFINCWVESTDQQSALNEATDYINEEGWEVVSIEEQFIANRKQYEDEYELKESLECFDEATSNGIAAIFNTWSDND